MKDNLYTRTATKKIMKGVLRCAQVVGATMGTSGNNALLEAFERPGYYPSNDGATILEAIRFADPLEELGRKIVYEAVSRANRKSGDGSSTTTVLTAAILEEGIKHLKESSPMEIKRSLEACIPLIEASIKAQARQITVDNIAPVASISAEDNEIGNRIQEIYQQIGKEGIISWDVSKTPEDYYTLGTGLTIMGAKMVSPYMGDVDEKTGAFLSGIKWTNPLILLCKQKITSVQDLNQLFFTLNQKDKKEIVIFCDDIDFGAIAQLVETRIKQGFRAVVVKMPVLWNDEWWLDLAKASGAIIIEPGSGVTLKEARESHLGQLGHITANNEDVFIDGIKDLSEHIVQLQQGEEKDILRASRLNTKTARYFVGGHSESSTAYRRLKVEDALNAASCALDEGIVAGGGAALLWTSRQLPKNTIGGKILKEALKSPIIQIIKNCGIEWLDKEKEVKEGYGFDAKSLKGVNMFDAQIVDPASVVINAVRSAIGVTATVLTTGNVVLLPREDKPLQ